MCDEGLPAIRRHGYYSPPDATVDEEAAAMTRQAAMRAQLRKHLAFMDGVRTTDGRTASPWRCNPPKDAHAQRVMP